MLKDTELFSQAVKSHLSSRGFTPNASVDVAGSAGSGRGYYRVAEGGKNVVVQTNASANEDFRNYAHFSGILKGVGVHVPQIYFKDEASAQLVIEDFGTHSLHDEVFPMEGSRRAAATILYDEVIEELIKMQVASQSVFMSYPEIGARKFDYAQLKWETDYFTENYLQKHLGLAEIPECVKSAFASIACAVDMQPRVLMHRDFQSENIMVLDDSSVGFIDFQGLRRGSQYYDLASLLWDPYVQMPVDLVQDFFKKWAKNFPGTAGFTDEELWISFLAASIQRLCQAMGAYCFLSKVKGIERFAKHIEPGKKQLKTVLELYREYSPAANKEANKFLCDHLV